MDIKAGSLVKLKSGGPVMTVTYVGEPIWCSYFPQNPELEMRIVKLPKEALELVEANS